jgi:hypothetical protein
MADHGFGEQWKIPGSGRIFLFVTSYTAAFPPTELETAAFFPVGKASGARSSLLTWYPLDRRLVGTQSRFEHGGEEKNPQSLPGLNNRQSSR